MAFYGREPIVLTAAPLGTGRWFKGNLHTHTTRSDGKLSPEHAAEYYRRAGYDFIALTDHRIFTDMPELGSENFLVLPGIETNINPTDTNNLDMCSRPRQLGYHINAFLADRSNPRAPVHDERIEPLPDYAGETIYDAVSRSAAELSSRGCLVTLNHPNWSRHACRDDFGVNGFFAMEIYNHVTETGCKTGNSVFNWDYCLRRGMRLLGIAVDDNHFVRGAAPCGFVMVRAPELTPEAIFAALAGGRFYSSCGPEIEDFCIEGQTVHVRCTPAERIRFITYEPMGRVLCASPGSPLTEAEYRLSGREKYVRVEVIDRNGFTAWTNPVWIRG